MLGLSKARGNMSGKLQKWQERKLKVLAGEQCTPPPLDRGQGVFHIGQATRAKPDTD